MLFRDIKGQDSAISFLKAAVDNGRVANAYIFVGPCGVGKKAVALNFAKAINCRSQQDERPCEKCESCVKINSSGHPDVVVIKPDEDSSSLKIGAIRELTRSIGLKPYEAAHKVYIIDEAPSMKPEAANALLKSLEEPSAGTVLILITESLDALLPTIRSRSQVVRFRPIGAGDVEDILTKSRGLDRERAGILSRISSGSLGKALDYNKDDFFAMRERVINGLADRTFFDSDMSGLSKESLKMCLDIALSWHRDVLIVKTAGERAPLINTDRRGDILKEAKRLSTDRLENAIRELISAGAFLDANANAKLVFAVLGMRLTEENVCTK